MPARAREQEHADAVDVRLDGLLEARREPAREREVEEEAPRLVALVVVLVRELVREHVEQRWGRAQLGAQVDVRARVRELLLPVAHHGLAVRVWGECDAVERVQRVVHAQIGHAQAIALQDEQCLVGEPYLHKRSSVRCRVSVVLLQRAQVRHAESSGSCLLLGRQARAEEKAGHVACQAVRREPHEAEVALREQQQREPVLPAHADVRMLPPASCVCSRVLFFLGSGNMRAQGKGAGQDARSMQMQRERILRMHTHANIVPP